MRPLLIAFLVALAWGAPARAGGIELVYVHETGCPYCRQWDRRIAPIYPRTEEGRRAPLRPIERAALGQASLKLARPVRYTPTFVLVDGDREIGRIEGFPGEDFFWSMLDRLLGRLPLEHGAPVKVISE